MTSIGRFGILALIAVASAATAPAADVDAEPEDLTMDTNGTSMPITLLELDQTHNRAFHFNISPSTLISMIELDSNFTLTSGSFQLGLSDKSAPDPNNLNGCPANCLLLGPITGSPAIFQSLSAAQQQMLDTIFLNTQNGNTVSVYPWFVASKAVYSLQNCHNVNGGLTPCTATLKLTEASSSAPEPGTWGLTGLAAITLRWLYRRRRQV